MSQRLVLTLNHFSKFLDLLHARRQFGRLLSEYADDWLEVFISCSPYIGARHAVLFLYTLPAPDQNTVYGKNTSFHRSDEGLEDFTVRIDISLESLDLFEGLLDDKINLSLTLSQIR